jgi:hypothetical protein
MSDSEDSLKGQAPFDDLLRHFDGKWAWFWAWLDSIGRNTPPMPSVSAASRRGKRTG